MASKRLTGVVFAQFVRLPVRVASKGVKRVIGPQFSVLSGRREEDAKNARGRGCGNDCRERAEWYRRFTNNGSRFVVTLSIDYFVVFLFELEAWCPGGNRNPIEHNRLR